ncbi:MAG: MurR/RpiR family transcriptional regulator [Oscillospiraceae bacterium]|nr:MurR/RpiR family transcriptional regulator [Oscillospiraceae bacterium]
MENDVLSLISQRNPGFSKGQRKIAKYITANYDKAAFMTASKLGKAAQVSESTVVRFAADLGYEGYPEMKRALQELIKNRLTTVQRIEVSKEIMERGHIVDTVLTSDVEKIRMTLDEIDRTSFEAAVQKIVTARSIYIVGLRSSGYLAGFFGFYLNFLFNDVRVVCDSAASAIFEQIQHIGSEDILIALSFPRYSRRTITAMQFARDMGAMVIGITDTENSLVAKNADIKLYAHSDMLSFLDSLVAPLSLINALIVASAEASGSDLEEKFRRLEKMWAEYEVYEKHE